MTVHRISEKVLDDQLTAIQWQYSLRLFGKRRSTRRKLNRHVPLGDRSMAKPRHSAHPFCPRFPSNFQKVGSIVEFPILSIVHLSSVNRVKRNNSQRRNCEAKRHRAITRRCAFPCETTTMMMMIQLNNRCFEQAPVSGSNV